VSNILRALVIGLLAVALLLPVRDGADSDSVIVYESSHAPDERALDSLAMLTARRPLLAARLAAPSLSVDAPSPLVAGRAAALSFRLRAAPGTEQRIVLRDAQGAAIDSTLVRADGQGSARAAFRVRPEREGWHEWRIEAAGEQRAAGAWAVAAAPPSGLLAAGAAGPESALIAAALEESGASVELRQPLGHGLSAGGVPRSLPASADELASYDVVILLPDAILDAARRGALSSFVQSGGGLLLATRDSLLFTLGLAAGPQTSALALRADSIDWDLPADIAALPAGSVSGVVEPIAPAADAYSAGAVRGAGVGPAVPLVLRAVGGGRVAALGPRETWRWRMEGGNVAAHREFWRSLVDWLAPAPGTFAEVRSGLAAPGVPTAVEVLGSVGAVFVHRPDGTTERLPLQPTLDESLARIAFVPIDTGVHVLRVDGAAVAAVRAVPGVAHESAARLSLLAAASGGRVVPRDALADSVTARGAGSPARATSWRTALFGLLLLLAAADWGVRRSRGQA
jgi:hypothetical protein